MRARYDAELPVIISIVRHPGRPVILAMDLLGNGRNTVSRVLFRRRELTELCGKLGEFCEKLGEFALAHEEIK